MKLINSSFEILEQGPGLQGIYKQIELAGRTCYKSLDKITDDSAEGFVNRMIASKHYAMLEHGTVHLIVPMYYANCIDSPCEGLDVVIHSPYSKVKYRPNPELKGFVDWTGREINTECYYITTNLRVIVENNLEHLLNYLCEPTRHHEKRVTVRFTTDRGVSHEFVRHRVFSFAQESTRYCNYSKDKFGNEITFIIPSWSDLREGTISSLRNGKPMWDTLQYTDDGAIIKDNYSESEMDFVYALQIAENMYLNSITHGLKPQQARQVLPNALKTELVMTGFISDWQHFFDLRARGLTGAPHPDAKALADPLMHEFESRKLI